MTGTVRVTGSQWNTQTLKETITEQLELIQNSLRALNHSRANIRPGISPLDTEHVAISACFIDHLNSEQVAGWAVVWCNKRLPISGSCHNYTPYPDFYYEFLALKEALLTTPHEQSITFVANTMILMNYMKHKRVIVNGKDVVGDEYQLLEPLITEIGHLIKGRTGKVEVVIIHEDLSWLMQLKDSAAVIAHAEQRMLRSSMLNGMSSSKITVNASDTSTTNSTNIENITQKKRKAPSAGKRPLLKRKVEAKPQSIATEPPMVNRPDEHTIPFIQVPRYSYQTSAQSAEESKKYVIDRVGEGSCVPVLGTGDSGCTSTMRANDSSRKRRTEHLVPMELESCKKQKAEPPSEDSDDDVYEDAVEYL